MGKAKKNIIYNFLDKRTSNAHSYFLAVTYLHTVRSPNAAHTLSYRKNYRIQN